MQGTQKMLHTVTFVGTGDSMGVPRVYCDCSVCEEARTSGNNRRYRSSVRIDGCEEGSLFIDCGPDWVKQMEIQQLRFATHILITHAHHDHIGGLPEWADACRWLKCQGQAYAPREVIDICLERYPWIANHIAFHPNDDGMSFGTWRITPWKVCHGKNGYSYAYRFDGGDGQAWAYCSDAIRLSEEEKRPLRGLDLLILGTNFYLEPYEAHTRSVYDMVEALELIRELRPRQTVFTHLSHDIDLARDYGLPDRVLLARTGMKLLLDSD